MQVLNTRITTTQPFRQKKPVLAATGNAPIDSSMPAPDLYIIAFMVFTTMTSPGPGQPFAACFLAQHSFDDRFAGWKDWLTGNNATVPTVLLPAFGLLLSGRGAGIIATGLHGIVTMGLPLPAALNTHSILELLD